MTSVAELDRLFGQAILDAVVRSENASWWTMLRVRLFGRRSVVTHIDYVHLVALWRGDLYHLDIKEDLR